MIWNFAAFIWHQNPFPTYVERHFFFPYQSDNYNYALTRRMLGKIFIKRCFEIFLSQKSGVDHLQEMSQKSGRTPFTRNVRACFLKKIRKISSICHLLNLLRDWYMLRDYSLGKYIRKLKPYFRKWMNRKHWYWIITWSYWMAYLLITCCKDKFPDENWAINFL